MRYTRLILALSFWSASGLAGSPAKTDGDPPVFRVGVCTHFSQGKGELPGNLELIRQAGIRSIRDECTWRDVEREKGHLEMPGLCDKYVRAAAAAGLENLLILDYGNRFYDGGDKPLSMEALEGFARYAEFMASHFKGVVRLYEVWNEWDIGIGRTTPGTAESYVKLLAEVYPRMKRIDPAITVYGGGMTPGGVRGGWLENMLKAGGLKHLDELSIHTYNYSYTGRERTPEAWAEWMNQVQNLARKHSGGKDVPVTVTEMGWPTQIDRRGTPAEIAAAYMARMFLLARTMPFMKGIWWYDFQDDGWRHSYNEHNFGLVRPDLTPKPGYFALSDIAGLVATAEYLGRVDVGDPEIYILKFRRPKDGDVWAAWSAHEDHGWQITLRTERPARQPVGLREIGRGSLQRSWGARDWAGDTKVESKPDELRLVIGPMPWLITGNLDGVGVTAVTQREFPELLRGIQHLR